MEHKTSAGLLFQSFLQLFVLDVARNTLLSQKFFMLALALLGPPLQPGQPFATWPLAAAAGSVSSSDEV